MRIEKMYRKNRFKRWVLLSMGILGLMLLAGIFSALDHRVDYGGMETAEQGWTRALTEGASGWEAETKALPGASDACEQRTSAAGGLGM